MKLMPCGGELTSVITHLPVNWPVNIGQAEGRHIGGDRESRSLSDLYLLLRSYPGSYKALAVGSVNG